MEGYERILFLQRDRASKSLDWGGGGGLAHLLSFPPLVDPNIANMFCRRLLTKRVEQHGQYEDNGS